MPQVRVLFNDDRPRQEIDVHSEKDVSARVVGDEVVINYLTHGDDGHYELARYPVADVEAVVTTIWTSTDAA